MMKILHLIAALLIFAVIPAVGQTLDQRVTALEEENDAMFTASRGWIERIEALEAKQQTTTTTPFTTAPVMSTTAYPESGTVMEFYDSIVDGSAIGVVGNGEGPTRMVARNSTIIGSDIGMGQTAVSSPGVSSVATVNSPAQEELYIPPVQISVIPERAPADLFCETRAPGVAQPGDLIPHGMGIRREFVTIVTGSP